MKKIKAIILKSMLFIIHLIPRDKRLWIFGSRFGLTYDQNSKYLFEYVNKAAKDIRAVWLTRSPGVYEHLRRKGYRVCMSYSLQGWLCSLAAGAVFVNVSSHDVNHLAISGSMVIQLCHGTPLKMLYVKSFGPNERYDIITLAAEEFLHNGIYPEFKANYGILAGRRNARLVLTGFPRADILLSGGKIESIEQLKKDRKCSRIISYMPTHRDRFSSDNYIEEFDILKKFGLNLDKLEDIMKRYNCLFVFKVHPTQRVYDGLMVRRIQESNNLYMVNPEDPIQDVYEYLKYTDVLITDYSSVYFDFLLMNRPVIFAPFDLDSYLANRPLIFSYDEVTPGPKAKNWNEVCVLLEDILGGKDDWGSFRRLINQRFNAFRDGSNSERVYREVRKALDI